jgi:GGDEF domain-containing protein
MSEDNPLQTLHTTVHCYLKTIQVVADSLAEACPPVGGPYRQRLSRLRARLAFDSSTGKIEESSVVMARELKEYSGKAWGYVEQHRAELRRAIEGLEHIARTLTQRQDFYGERLRQFARQMEAAPKSADAENPAEAAGVLSEQIALQAAGLLSCIDSMSHESHSLLKRMRDEMARVEKRLADAEITDPVTGLMNRSEMERRLDAVLGRGESTVLLLFEFRDPLPNEVAQQVGARLGLQFRHNDLIARWSERQFLVLFQGLAETARSRAHQVAAWLAGRYLLESGATVETAVEARLLETPASELEPTPVPQEPVQQMAG